mmetsp:Transcript_1325/g.4156  ORF Transcript_1325/g.4156 Transcript_1325/m.4156 type:complete len:340 (+) Transcript_1325:507-1526(+)
MVEAQRGRTVNVARRAALHLVHHDGGQVQQHILVLLLNTPPLAKAGPNAGKLGRPQRRDCRRRRTKEWSVAVLGVRVVKGDGGKRPKLGGSTLARGAREQNEAKEEEGRVRQRVKLGVQVGQVGTLGREGAARSDETLGEGEVGTPRRLLGAGPFASGRRGVEQVRPVVERARIFSRHVAEGKGGRRRRRTATRLDVGAATAGQLGQLAKDGRGSGRIVGRKDDAGFQIDDRHAPFDGTAKRSVVTRNARKAKASKAIQRQVAVEPRHDPVAPLRPRRHDERREGANDSLGASSVPIVREDEDRSTAQQRRDDSDGEWRRKLVVEEVEEGHGVVRRRGR